MKGMAGRVVVGGVGFNFNNECFAFRRAEGRAEEEGRRVLDMAGREEIAELLGGHGLSLIMGRSVGRGAGGSVGSWEARREPRPPKGQIGRIGKVVGLNGGHDVARFRCFP